MRVKRRILFLLGLFAIVVVILLLVNCTRIHSREYQVTFHYFNAIVPLWSPDSKLLAYEADEKIWVKSLITGKEILVSHKELSSFPNWSPGGRNAAIIYYYSENNNETEIWTFDYQIKNWKLIKRFNKEIISGPMWTTDERRIKVVIANEEERKTEIWEFSHTEDNSVKIMEFPFLFSSAEDVMWCEKYFVSLLDNSIEVISLEDKKSIIKESFSSKPGYAVFSNDQNKIAFFMEDSSGLHNLYILFISTGELRDITPRNVIFEESYSLPFWAPNDRYLGFSGLCKEDNSISLYAVSLSTNDVERITFGNSKETVKRIDIFGSWSPDGNKIAFSRKYLQDHPPRNFPFSSSDFEDMGHELFFGADFQIWIVRVPKARRYSR